MIVQQADVAITGPSAYVGFGHCRH